MVSLEKWMILTPLQKLTKNGEDWGKLIVAKCFKKLPKVQNIAQSGHTDPYLYHSLTDLGWKTWDVTNAAEQ